MRIEENKLSCGKQDEQQGREQLKAIFNHGKKNEAKMMSSRQTKPRCASSNFNIHTYA